ncbi:TPA: hypothetical protein ACSP3U_000165 [Aeromonas hydrophila]
MTVFYWLIISLLCSILMAVTLPADLFKIADSNLVAGCLLLLLGSIILPRLMEGEKKSHTREVILAELSMLVDFTEEKLTEMIDVLMVHSKVKNRYAKMVCPINRWSGEIGYWAEIGDAKYDFNEREILTRAEIHLNWANEVMDEEYNRILAFVKEGGLVQHYQRAEHVIMSLVFFIYYSRSVLVRYGKVENKNYAMHTKISDVGRLVDVVLSDIKTMTIENQEFLKKKLPLE